MKKKIFIILAGIVGVTYAIGNITMALKLNFPDIKIQSFVNKFSFIHFMAPGNDFVGSAFWLSSKSIPGITITLNGASKTCTKQIRGIYFNSQRGKRLRPLDSETLTLLQDQNNSYNNLSITGGLYTSCENDPYSVFGAITYVREGNTGHIVAGTKLNYQQNKIEAQFGKSLQYFDNKVLIGYLYDSNGGIGYVGGELSGHNNLIHFLNTSGSVNEAFIYSGDSIVSSHPNDRQTMIKKQNNEMETMRNLIIQGSVGLSKSINNAERTSLLGNFQNKTIIYNGGNINSSTLINIAKQKAQTLCQGKNSSTADFTLAASSERIICIENNNVTINLTDSESYENKTIIVKNGNVILEGGMQENSPVLNIFVDKGIFYLPSDPIIWQTFNNQGFLPNELDEIISSGLYLKGNFIINGLMLPAKGTLGFNHKLHLQGKITLLNTPLEASEGKTNQIENMFGTNTYNDFINLQRVFTRTCGLNGRASDRTPATLSLCNTGDNISTTPLIILNGNYPSILLQ